MSQPTYPSLSHSHTPPYCRYKKFLKSKDLSSKTDEDMACVLGRKKRKREESPQPSLDNVCSRLGSNTSMSIPIDLFRLRETIFMNMQIRRDVILDTLMAAVNVLRQWK